MYSVYIPWENYPVTNRYGFRVPTGKVYPCYDIRNRHMGYMDNETFYDMRELFDMDDSQVLCTN